MRRHRSQKIVTTAGELPSGGRGTRGTLSMVHSPVIACELVGGLWRARGTGEGVPTPDSPKPQNLKMKSKTLTIEDVET